MGPNKSRVGVIIDCHREGLFHDPRDVILTSQMAVSDLADNNNYNVVKICKITILSYHCSVGKIFHNWISGKLLCAKWYRCYETILSGRVMFTRRRYKCGRALCLHHYYSVSASSVVHWHWKREYTLCPWRLLKFCSLKCATQFRPLNLTILLLV